MRFVVYGAGAVGGVTGALLAESGHDVTLIARGAHLSAIRASGLTVTGPRGPRHVEVPAVEDPAEIEWQGGEVVLLCVKAQHTASVLAQLAIATTDVAIVCLQNGVVNEHEALRWFADVYGVPVLGTTGHVEPGVVSYWSEPVVGVLDIGRFPSGTDAMTAQLAEAFSTAGFPSVERPDIQRWKYAKLIRNLGNAADALFGPVAETPRIMQLARDEGERVLSAAGIDFVSFDDFGARYADILDIGSNGEPGHPGSSTWQSLQRNAGSVETDYLNGEIVALGRLHDVPTPVNSALQRWTLRAAVEGRPPGTADPGKFIEATTQ